MAKMFYTMEETKSALGRNEEGIKQLAREGRLREFRDGPRLMFKADQVDALKGELAGGGDQISLNPSESGAPLSLAGDSRGGSSLSLADTGPKGGTGTPIPKDDTQFDIGLSGSLGGSVAGGSLPGGSVAGGSLGGIPSPSKDPGGTRSGSGVMNLSGSVSGAGMTGSGSGAGASRGGITVFDVDDAARVDPSAQTAINPNVQDQINLEGVGSGSGLLDLTRESDDTSLGAVFDELTPGSKRSAPAASMGGTGASPALAETQAGADLGMAVVNRGARATLAAPIYVEAADPWANALGLGAVGACAILVFGGFILASALMGYRPDILDTISKGGFMYLGIAVGVVVVLTVIGLVLGKSSARTA